jgi:hypothetical protein
MKANVSFPKRTNWLKALGVLITCLLFLIPPACERPEPDQESLSDTDEMVATPRAANTATKMYWGPRGFSKDYQGGSWYGDDYMWTSWLENFENFVLKVVNTGGASKISKLEVSIDNVVIITAKGLNRDYFATKTLRSPLTNGSHLEVLMEGDQGCSINVWIEGTIKLGKVYGRHYYYKTRQGRTWDETIGFCNNTYGYPVIINDVKENNFVLNLANNRGFFIGLTDLNHDPQDWWWIDNTRCRTVNWNINRCGVPNSDCPQPAPPEGYPIPWNQSCMVITDYGYNNWNEGEPNNGGGGCDSWQMENHRDENVAVVDWNGKWSDVPTDPGYWDNGQWDNAMRNCVVEWDAIPSSGDIYKIFREDYPEYNYPW